jgi:hypothetical protein|tara:strand:+ start:944 stop:2992 length:2049 start_codon:yes stop_codon:yes gene_type:complete
MNRQEILQELKERGVNPNVSNSNESQDNSPQISREEILKELGKRGLKQNKETGIFLPTREKQKQDDPFGMATMVDDMEIAPVNYESQAVADYLSSKEFARLALEITGGVVGAAFAPAIAPAVLIGRAAMAVRPALQASVTRMAGAGIGEAGGALTSQTFDPTFNSKSDFAEIFGSISKDMLKKAAIGSTGEGAGQLIGKGITKVLSRNKKLLDGAEEAVQAIEEQKTKILANPKSYKQEIQDAINVGQLTPGLLQKGQTIDILENVAESSLFGGGSLRYAKEGANTIAESGLTDFINAYKVKAGDGALGNLFQRTLTKDLQDFKSIANVKYKAVDDALKGANVDGVDITNLKQFASDELKNLGAKSESTKLKSFLKGILDEKNIIPFKRANILRGDYLEISKTFTTESLGKKKGRLASIAASDITDAIDNSIIPNNVKGLLKEANKHYREGAEVFNDTLFKKIIDNDPDLVYKSIVAAGDRPTLINKTFDILNKRIKDVDERNLLKNKIRGAFLDDIMTKSQRSNDQFGVELDAEKLFKNFMKKEDTFKAMFSTKELTEFKKFQNALKFAQGRKSKTGGLPGGMMIQMKQSGALIQIASSASAYGTGMKGMAAGILIAPAVIAKAFTTPKIIKALTLGIKYQDKPSLSRRYFLQAITHMADDNLVSKDDLDNIKKELKDNQE